MCYMMVVALPPEAQQRLLVHLPEGMRFWPSRYEELPVRMKHWQPVIVGTGRMCSCDLFKFQADENIDSLRSKYAKQGWSQAKIGRALVSRKPSGFEGNLHPELRRWLADAVTEAGEAYLFVHWDSSMIEINPDVTLSISELQNTSYQITDEQLYHIHFHSQS